LKSGTWEKPAPFMTWKRGVNRKKKKNGREEKRRTHLKGGRLKQD